ncbi:hypothetical protein Tcan_07560 [Toxocara canis]|uniref:Lysosomal-associated transmembrane protein 4A n=1 Tax=Toxocara canis TaxID=6265 RepID=A0A0B2VU39_TOXCA|nr:hypothetical protein Tcan_07560 [Toxocara canis]
MMNGRSVRSMLIRNQEPNGMVADSVPKSIQFDESSDDYRCLCNCFHVKTGALLVGVAEIVMLVFFFVNSLLVFAAQDKSYHKATGLSDSFVSGPFIASMIGIGISSLVVLLLFIGIARNCAVLLIPHIVVQVLIIIVLLLALIDGIIAFSTNSTLFYRLLNAAPFNEHPGTNTVSLDTENSVRVYGTFVLYAISFAVECWFIVIIYNCNRYLDERRVYMLYCLTFSTPMKTLSAR